jgi:hypothetical protein
MHFEAIGYVVALSAARITKVVGIGIGAVVDRGADVAMTPIRLRLEALSPRR